MNAQNKTATAWLLFYKGTGVQIPISTPAKIITLWESTIAEGLRHGVGIKTQRQQILEDLNEMESFLVKTFKGEWDARDLQRILGVTDYNKFINKWGLNVICGLKLKVFKDDEMNGSLVLGSLVLE